MAGSPILRWMGRESVPSITVLAPTTSRHIRLVAEIPLGAVVMNGDVDGPDPVPGSLLAYLGDEPRASLLSRGVPASFAADDVLLRCGEQTDHVLIVLRGWVRVAVRARDGQQLLVGLRGPGDIVGDLAALNALPRMATVCAVDDVHAVRLTAQQFQACLRRYPDVVSAMVQQMAMRLREAEAVRVNLATLDVSRRVAAYLDRLGDRHGVRGTDGVVIGMPLTQQDIASQVGASTRAVCRSMALLRERRLVATSRRRIVVMRPDALRSLAHRAPDVEQHR